MKLRLIAPRRPAPLLGMALGGILVLLGSTLSCTREERPPAALPSDETIRAFVRAEGRGYQALEADSLEVALASFTRMLEIIPDSPLGHYDIACAHGRQGATDRAVAALRAAIDRGYSDLERAAHDPDLAVVREHASWSSLVTGMEQARTGQQATLHALLQPLAPQGEPSFPTLDSLRAHYGKRFVQAANLRRVYPDLVAARHAAGVLNGELAGLERFKQEHATPPQPYRADLARLAVLGSFADMDARPWIVGREMAAAHAEHILTTYPDSAGAAMAALWKARAEWYGRQQATLKGQPASEVEEAVAALRSVARAYPATVEGAQALAEAIALRAEFRGGGLESVRELVGELVAGFDTRRESLGPHAYEVNDYILQLRGAPDFSATDIDGRTWSLRELRGRAALLDFWATWCGPCRAEIPTLVALSRKYAPEEFQILGISLDTGERLSTEALRAWTADHEMSWPQIYEGAGWQSALPALYNVPAIPFPVLLDPQGNVVAAGMSARGEKLEEKLAAILGR